MVECVVVTTNRRSSRVLYVIDNMLKGSTVVIWREVLSRLAGCSRASSASSDIMSGSMIKWQLRDEEEFYLIMANNIVITDEYVDVDERIYYRDILFLELSSCIEFSRWDVRHNLDEVNCAIMGLDGINISRSESSLIIRLSKEN